MSDSLEERVGNGLLGTFCGAIYGLGLFVPAAILTGPDLGFFAPLIIWPVAGFLLGVARHRGAAIGLLAIHAAGVACVLLWGSGPFGESSSEQWDRLARMRPQAGNYADMAVAAYLVGQVVAWALALVPRRAPDQ